MAFLKQEPAIDTSSLLFSALGGIGGKALGTEVGGQLGAQHAAERASLAARNEWDRGFELLERARRIAKETGPSPELGKLVQEGNRLQANSYKLPRALKLRGRIRGRQIGGTVGMLAGAGLMYALTNPRMRNYLAGLIN